MGCWITSVWKFVYNIDIWSCFVVRKSIIFMWFDLFSNNFYSGIFIVFFVYWNGFEFIYFNILKHLFCGKMIDNNLLLYFMVYYLVFVFDRNMKSPWPYSLKKSKLFPSFIFYFDDELLFIFASLIFQFFSLFVKSQNSRLFFHWNIMKIFWEHIFLVFNTNIFRLFMCF